MRERSRVRSAMRGLISLLAGVAGLAAAYLVAAPLFEIGGVKAPAARSPVTVRLDQGWREYESTRFHHTSQGTRILPLKWFMALEQPVLTPLPVGRLADRDYLGRFGFIYETERPGDYGADAPARASGDPEQPGSPEYEAILRDRKEYDLPVGFAIDPDFWAPYADPPYPKPTPVVGLTCAACHTGRLDILLEDGTSKSVLIDGGSSMIHITQFQDAVRRSLFYTQLFPQRFSRFSRAILGENQNDTQVEELRKTLDRFIELGLASSDYAKEHKLNGTESGFSRTDALGLIGNRVFGVVDEGNQVVTDAPVNFPHLWDTPWFDWVQYNGSIRTPMARNIGEALGVGALVNLTDKDFPLYESTVDIANLSWMEDALGGHDLFQGLQPPSWDDMVQQVFGGDVGPESPYYINEEIASKGKELYEKHCIRCHLPPRETLEGITDRSDREIFSEPDKGSGKQFLRLNVVDLNVIGTDPNQALNFYRRIAVSPEPPTDDGSSGAPPTQEQDDAKKGQALGQKYAYWSRWVKRGTPEGEPAATISAEDGLFRVTSMIRRREYKSLEYQLLPPEWPSNISLQQLEEGQEGEIRAEKNLIVVASVGGTLHCQVFDDVGYKAFDLSETDVKGKADEIRELKGRLEDHWNRTLTEEDRKWIRDQVVSIFLAKYGNEGDRARVRRKWDRYRTIPEPLDLGDEGAIIEGKGKDWVIAANLGYRARPHDGIWATPPYLHNGSVPNLYQMLLPASQRSEKFYLGSTRFDPKHVGYETTRFPGAFLMDTTLAGNSNAGHEFRNLTLKELETKPWDGKSTLDQRWAAVLGVDEAQYKAMTEEQRHDLIKQKSRERLEKSGSAPIKGVLGPEFEEEERWQLVEYLKTL